MIGNKARGIGHAVRIANGEPRQILYFSEGNTHPKEGLIYESGSEVYILNNEIHNTRHANSQQISDLMISSGFRQILCFEKNRIERSEYRQIVKYLYVLPIDFNKQYYEFLSANKKLFANLSAKIGEGSFNNPFSKYIYIISDGSKNFFQWAHICRSKNSSIVTIDQILRWAMNYPQLAKNLKKGSITAYTSYDDLFSLINEQMTLRREKRVVNTISMFNTAQKKLLREVPFSNEVYDIMSRFNRLSDVKKNNFIRKMSTVEDAKEILHQMSFVADCHFKWNKADFMEYIKNNEMVSVEVVYDKDDIVLVMVQDYDTIKRIAKNTSWCISKNKTYWNNYMSKSHIANGVRQFVLFDFSKKEDDERSIVGFTLHVNKGITASHDFVNTNILDRKFSMNAYLRKRFNTLLPNKQVNGGIHAILISKGIDISSLIKTGKIPYLWNSDSFFKYLSKTLGDDESFDILSDHDGRVAVLVENEKIRSVLGSKYSNSVPQELWKNEHILFLDFNESPDSPNKLCYGIIEFNSVTKESYCDVIRNENSEIMPISFDSLLDEYELPYDIICRTNSKYDRVLNAFISYDLNTVRKLIGDEDVVVKLKSKEDSYQIFSSIAYTIDGLMSDEYFKAIYNNGVSLSDMLTIEHMVSLCDILVINHLIISHGKTPTEDDLKVLFKRDGSIDSTTAETFAAYHIINMILDNEKPSECLEAFKNRLKYHSQHNKKNILFDIIKRIKETEKEPSLSGSIANNSKMVNVF